MASRAKNISGYFEGIFWAANFNLIMSIMIYLSACSTFEKHNLSGNYHFLPFRMIGNRVPVVEVRLNDKKAWFIIDTGSSFTFLNQAEADKFGFHVKSQHTGESKNINGLGGRLFLYETVSCRIGLGYLFVKNFPWKSGDINRLASVIKEHENINIVGILGGDFLSKFRININYETRTLSYKINGRGRNKD